jgi:cysteine desulfurase/selenocysteine lyase
VKDVEAIRADFPALEREISFDNGTVSLTPGPVGEALERYLRDVLQGGPPHVVRPEEEYPRRERTREAIAAFLGTGPRQLAIVRGVSEAFHTVLDSLSWRPGDEVVLTEDEEAALLLPALHLRATVGVRVVALPFERVVERGPQDALDSVLSERTRLVALSHVTTSIGYRYPVTELCAATRSRGVLSFLDLAHSAGLVPLALDELGCDLAGIVSYKWMYAPYAAGAFYVRPEALDRLELRFAGNRSEASLDAESGQYELRDDARRFEYGPWAWSIVHAWANALEYLERAGRAAIWERTQRHVAALRDRLGEIAGVRVLTPPAAAAAALVTFEVAGIAASDVRQRLLTSGIRIKALPDDRRLRASVAMFTSDSDIDALVAAVASVGAVAEARR